MELALFPNMTSSGFTTAAGSATLVALLALAVTVVAQTPERTRQPDPAVLAEFDKRVGDYMAIHEKAKMSIAALPDKATPEQITKTRTQLSELIRAARPGAAPGDLLTEGMAAYVRDMLAAEIAGPGGANLKGSIMDENPVGTSVKVNQTYPPEIPLSTMPPSVLSGLPKIPEELEFRFVGNTLVILDRHADLIVDLLRDALPG
jgi:hypothetical protein